jgi:glutathione S-transferase
MEIALYYAPITCALAPYITLTEAGATFEVRPLNFRKGQHTSPEYLKINPKHKVPLLIVDGKVFNSPPRVCDVAGTEASVTKLASANLLELFKIADDLLADREFFFDHFTAPDAHFFWCQRRARQFELDLAGFKHCAAHFERMLERPSVQKLLTFEKSVQDEFAKAA